MFTFGLVIGGLGLIIWFWMFGGASVLAWLLGQLRALWQSKPRVFLEKHQERSPSQKVFLPSITLAIPAHNEAHSIEATLRSVTQASEYAKLRFPKLSVRIAVLLDHSTDQTSDILARLQSEITFDVWRHSGLPGKWWGLQALNERADSEWIAYVDCGAIWDECLLVQWLQDYFQKETFLAGWAPSYAPRGAGLLERMYWNLEALLKYLENAAGGPVSVHGATVFYQRAALSRAFQYLGQETHWLNDDVVLPLVFRKLNLGPIHYAIHSLQGRAWVHDLGVVPDLSVEAHRRERMSIGNIQWMREALLLPNRSDLLGWVLVSRRMARTLWAYAFLFSFVGVLSVSWSLMPALSLGVLIALGVLVLRVSFLQRLSTAIQSALKVPQRLFKFSNKEPVTWG